MTDLVHLSKTLSYVLRHRPQSAGLVLDEQGWVGVDQLLGGLHAQGTHLTPEQLEELVRSSDKQRFALSPDGLRIRANQGHTTKQVALTFQRATPPAVLFHGTVALYLKAIFRKGLLPMKRHHVHLSATVAAATEVGARRGAPVVLRVNAADMVADRQPFWLTPNGVWLADKVAAKYLTRD